MDCRMDVYALNPVTSTGLLLVGSSDIFPAIPKTLPVVILPACLWLCGRRKLVPGDGLEVEAAGVSFSTQYRLFRNRRFTGSKSMLTGPTGERQGCGQGRC